MSSSSSYLFSASILKPNIENLQMEDKNHFIVVSVVGACGRSKRSNIIL